MNHGTAGSYELLFPRSDTGGDNRVEAAKEYVVPASQGWFKVSGPAGQDVIYWLVSPVELGHAIPPLLLRLRAHPARLPLRCGRAATIRFSRLAANASTIRRA